MTVTLDVAAQAVPASTITNRRSGIDLFIGYGMARWSGSSTIKGRGSMGVAGLGIERPIGSRHAFRTELAASMASGDLGNTGIFDLPTTLTLDRIGLGGHLRRYAAGGLFVGLGAALEATSACDIDTEGGPGFLGGQTESCNDFEDIEINSRSVSALAIITAGVERGPYGIDLRIEQDMLPTVETPGGDARSTRLGLVLHYRFGTRKR